MHNKLFRKIKNNWQDIIKSMSPHHVSRVQNNIIDAIVQKLDLYVYSFVNCLVQPKSVDWPRQLAVYIKHNEV